MSAPHRSWRLARDDHGAVLVFFALFAPVAVVFMSFVIDVGNWFWHARHLQLQADAGALAAAQAFQGCNNSSVRSFVAQYSGVSGTPLYNVQIGGTSAANIHELINSTTYYGQASPVDGTVNTAEPCEADMVDVKMTETALPWYFKLLSVPFINAHARVEILNRFSGTGGLPVAVNDLNPKSAEAYFVNEATGEQLASTALTNQGTSGSLAIWSNSTPVAVKINHPGIAVRIGISGRSTLTGNMTTDCSQKLVLCYDASSSSLGVLHIQGYSGSGTGSVTKPIIRKVTLGPGGATSCNDGYFSNPESSCTIGISAAVDFGANPNPEGASVKGEVTEGNKTRSFALKYQTGTGLWSTKEATVGALAGSLPVTITVSDKEMKGSKVSLTGAQKSYTADTNSGPIKGAVVSEARSEPSGPILVPDADSFQECDSTHSECTHNLVVTIDITGTLKDAQSVSDPLYTMRFTGTGSQNQSIRCKAANGGATFADMIASGCGGEYAINRALSCPDTNTPIDCLRPETGNTTNQVPKGMNERVLGSPTPEVCTSPNHWKEFIFENGAPTNVSPADPRVVTVFVTPYGSFAGSGAAEEFPISDFATFYVTGWQGKGEGFSNPCQGNGDDTAEAGTIVGHFIKYVDTDGSSTGEGFCSWEGLNECVAVLTN